MGIVAIYTVKMGQFCQKSCAKRSGYSEKCPKATFFSKLFDIEKTVHYSKSTLKTPKFDVKIELESVPIRNFYEKVDFWSKKGVFSSF